jgi:SAM-dependent methyltransferase
MAEFNHMYQRATYYDIVFKRDVSRELDFVSDLYYQRQGRSPCSLVDLACGPGYHARAFAKRGGTAYGLDLRAEMTAFADEQARAEGVEVNWLAADMRHFRLEEPVDLIINMFDGIDCLNSNEDLLAHFNAVAHNLTPGGLYLLDVTHPAQVGYGYYGNFTYSGERDGISVEIRWATNKPSVHACTGVAETEIEMHIDDHGQKHIICDCAYERIITAPEIELLCWLSNGLRVLGFYGDFDLNQPLDNSPTSRRMIGVLQKFG